MVERGQFLERMAIIPVAGGVLEGLYHRGAGAAPVVLSPPLPGEGGDMDLAPLAEACWALTQAGHPTMRYNHRGVGASTAPLTEGATLDDLLAVVEDLALTEAAARVGVCAVGGAGVVALEAAARSPRLRRLCLLNPSPSPALEAAARSLGASARPVEVVALLTEDLDGERAPLRERLAGVGPGAVRFEVIEASDQAFLRGLPGIGRGVVEAFA